MTLTVTVAVGRVTYPETSVRSATAPSAVRASTTPPYSPAVPVELNSRSADASPRAGTTTVVADRWPSPAGAGWPFHPDSVRPRFSVTGRVPLLVYVTGRSTTEPSGATGPRLTVAVAVTSGPMTRATSTRPVPCADQVTPTSLALFTRASLSRPAVQSGCRCARIAAAPATCGVAIEVPDSVV